MPSQRQYKELKGFRQRPYDAGYALAYLVGRRKDTGLWEVVHHGEFSNTTQALQAIGGHASREYPALNYTWLGAMSDDAIKLAFQKDQTKEVAS